MIKIKGNITIKQPFLMLTDMAIYEYKTYSAVQVGIFIPDESSEDAMNNELDLVRVAFEVTPSHDDGEIKAKIGNAFHQIKTGLAGKCEGGVLFNSSCVQWATEVFNEIKKHLQEIKGTEQ